FQANGITWNMQSDWVYLTNVITKETAQVTMTTAGKNIQSWLHEDKGVEMDPHAHESQYLYPDVVALMDSIGLPESKVMGGTIYNDFNGINLWMNLVNGQNGIIFPDRFWRPDYMMGGGTPNHVADLDYYGFWNPRDTANYLVHDSTSHLRHLGTGCSIKIQDTTTVAYVMGQVHEVVDNVQGGIYPPDGFYLQTIFFEQAGLNDLAFYQKVVDIADSVDAVVGTGVAEWKTFKQAYTQWDSVLGAQVFQWECGQVITGSQDGLVDQEVTVVPSPFTDHLGLNITTGREQYALHNLVGQVLWRGLHIEEQDLSWLPSGTYILAVSGGAAPLVSKVVKQ
ncbi:MAG: T9SS type A sorting domain-containing protein, partial [Flavobacteriales bacterium]